MSEGAGSTERESLKALVEELERECPEPTVEELERSAAAGPGPGSGKGSPPVAAPGPS
jgi:hypothetical protein